MKTIWIVVGAAAFALLAGVAVVAGLVLFLRSDNATVAFEPAEVQPAEPDSVDDRDDDDADHDDGSTDGDNHDGDDHDGDIKASGDLEPVLGETRSIEVSDGDSDDFDGEIGENTFDVFEIELDAGAEVVVTVRAADASFDTLLRAVSPDGAQAAYNDDADAAAGLANLFDSQLTLFTDTSGVFEIEVLSYDALSGGAYVLTVDRSGEVSTPDDVEFAPATVGGAGGLEDAVSMTTATNTSETVSASLDDPTALDSFTFELEAGETVLITAEADPGGELDPVITLYDAAGGTVATNDDADFDAVVGQATDSGLDVRVVKAGEYTVEVTSYAGRSSGEYDLTLQRSAGDGGGAPPVDELLDIESSLFVDPGQTISIEGRVESESFYDLLLTDGDTVTITVESADPESFDPAVYLDFGVYDMGSNDDAVDSDAVADAFDSQLELQTAHTGIHTIVVTGYEGSSGDFTMTVERS